MSGVELGSAHVAIRATQDQLQKDLASARSTVSSSMADLAKVAATAGVALAAAFVVAGAAAFKLGETFDAAYDTIRAGTGATGKALEGLKADFKAVVADVPTDFNTASAVISELNKRTGATGETLQGLSKTILEFSRITGTDAVANVGLATRVFGDWSIASEDQAGTLDKVFRASQATGLGVGELMGKVVQFGAPLRAMGFSLDESAALLGKWEKEGVNTELVLGSMRIAMGKFADAGIPARKGLEDTIAKITALGPSAAATSLAMDTFGARAGPDMAAAILEGRFALGDLVNQITNGGETIMGAAADTADGAERMQLAWNRVAVSFEPVGTAVFGVAGALAEKLAPAVERAAEWLAPLIVSFADKLPAAFTRVEEAVAPFLSEFQTIKATAENIAGAHGIGLVPAALIALELRLGEVFGPDAQAAFNKLQEAIKAVPGTLDKVRDALGEVKERIDTASKFVSDHREVQDALSAVISGLTLRYLAMNAAIAVTPALVAAAAAAQVIWNTALVAVDLARYAGLVIALNVQYGLNAAAAAAAGVVAGVLAVVHGVQAVAAGAAAAATWALNGALAVLTSPITLVVVGIAALAAGLVWAWQNFDLIKEKVGGFFDILGTLASEVTGKAADIGRNIVAGILGALNSTWNGLVERLSGLVNMLPAAVRSLLGIASPSTVFREIGEQVGEGFAEGLESIASALDAVLPVTKDLVAKAQQDINDALDEENRKTQRDREIDEIKHGRRVADLQAELGAAKLSERKAVAEKIAEAQTDHLRKLEDMERSHADRVIELEYDAGAKLVAARQKQSEQTGTALAEFGRGFAAATSDLQEKANALAVRIRTAMTTAGVEAAKSTRAAWDTATAAMEKAAEALAQSRFLRGIRDAFSAQQDLQGRIHDKEREDAETTYQRALDLKAAGVSRDADLGKARLRFDRDLREADSAEERHKLQDEYDAERDAIREEYADTVTALAARQQLEDAAIAHRRQLEEDERKWRAGQEQARRDFEDGLENTALQKSIMRLAAERDQRIADIQTALGEKQAAIVQQEKDERAVLVASYEDKIKELRENLIAKLPALLGEAQTELDTFLNGVATSVAATSASIVGAASAAAIAMARMGGGGGGSSSDVMGSITTTLAAIATAGGSVSPQLGASLLNAGTAATGIGPGGQVGGGIMATFNSASMPNADALWRGASGGGGNQGGTLHATIELDGIAVGRAVVPYVAPESQRFSGSRIAGV